MRRNSVIIDVLIRELENNQKMTLEYELQLKQLPKGSIVKRKIGNQEYCYLSRREGKKVVAEYLGKCGEVQLVELEKKIEQRRRLEKYLRELKLEKKEIDRMLK